MGAHRISYGAGYRYARDDTTPTPIVHFSPEDRDLHWGTLFAQDQVALTRTVDFTAGAKVQATPYVSAEVMPDLRLDYKPKEDQLAWAAASRVARTPGRIDRDFVYPGTPPFIIRGGPDFKSETGNVFEIGYRGRSISWLTFSVATFYAQLHDLRGGRIASDGAAVISNEAEGNTTGIEAWAIVQPTTRWRLTFGLLELRQRLRPKPGSVDFAAPASLGNDPRHTIKVRSAYRVTDRIDFDLSWRYVSALSYLTTVPAYQEADARLAWRLYENLEVAVLGSNLLHGSHVEFDEHGIPAPIPRAAYFQARLKF